MQYRKNTVAVDARQWNGSIEDAQKIITEVGGGVVEHDTERDVLVIHALGGDMIAEQFDYLVRGVKGELYPVKPEPFEATHSPADEPIRVPLGQTVIFTEHGDDTLAIAAHTHPREGIMVLHRSAELIILTSQQWVHPEDGDTVNFEMDPS